MKKTWKQKAVWLSATVALLLVATVSLPKAMAYFTTYASASGGVPITIESTETEITENVNGLAKEITLKNTSSQEEYVRVKVFCGSEFSIAFSNESGKWSQGAEGYWYYSDILPSGKTTEPLLAAITVPEEQEREFDVIVVQEATPVLYDESGKAYADWTLKADVSGEEAGE